MNLESHKKFLGVPVMLAISGFALAISVSLICFVQLNEPMTLIKNPDGSFQLGTRPIWYAVLEHAATALFILGAWHTIDQLIVKKVFKSEMVSFIEDVKRETSDQNSYLFDRLDSKIGDLKTAMTFANHDAQLGLIESYHKAEAFDFSAMIRDAHHLTAVLADGNSWVGRNSEAFMDRFKDRDKRTTIILVHPECDLIPALSRKVGMQPELFRQRIFGTIRNLNKLNREGAPLKILGHSLVTCHAVYITDRTAVYSPYFLSTERRSPPIFVLKDTGVSTSFFAKLCADVAVLERECSPIVEQLRLDYFDIDSTGQRFDGGANSRLV